MILHKLSIELQQWGDLKGQYLGEAVFVGTAGKVGLNLTPDLCNKLFAICSEGILNTAKEAANSLACNVLEHAEQVQLTLTTSTTN